MTTAIYELARQIQADPASVDAFFESHSFPIVEESCVTFVYRGEADAVLLQHWIYDLPRAQPYPGLALVFSPNRRMSAPTTAIRPLLQLWRMAVRR